MDELIDRVAKAASIPADTSRRATGLVLAFLKRQAPAEFAELARYLPGMDDAVSAGKAETGGGGAMGGLANLFGGGGVMAVAAQLTGLGLSTGQMTSVGREILAFAREKGGAERVDRVARAIPGLAGLL